MARFREGIEQVELLLTRESVTHHGRFHTIENTTSLPRPTQRPRPKFYVAALNTPDSFAFAGERGYSVMAIPLGGAAMRPLLGAYRNAWKAAGHPGEGEVMLAFHMFCDADGERARAFARPLIDAYLGSLVDAACDWLDGQTSRDYPGYDKVIDKLRQSQAPTRLPRMPSGSAHPMKSSLRSAVHSRNSAAMSTPRCKSISTWFRWRKHSPRCGYSPVRSYRTLPAQGNLSAVGRHF